MRGFLFRLLTTMVLVCIVSCGGRRALGPQHESDRISREEILAGSYSTAYDVVRALHPNWLRLRNAQSSRVASQIWVYMDGTRYGGISWLSNIRATTVASIDRIDGPTATTRWGSGHTEGVIYVTSINQSR